MQIEKLKETRPKGMDFIGCDCGHTLDSNKDQSEYLMIHLDHKASIDESEDKDNYRTTLILCHQCVMKAFVVMQSQIARDSQKGII